MTPNLQYIVEMHRKAASTSKGVMRCVVTVTAPDVGKAMVQALLNARDKTPDHWVVDRVFAGEELLYDAGKLGGVIAPSDKALEAVMPKPRDWVVAWEDIAAIREPRHIDKAIMNTAHLNGNNVQDKDSITRYVLRLAIGQGRMNAVIMWMMDNDWFGPRP